jgi:hypothetical protein
MRPLLIAMLFGSIGTAGVADRVAVVVGATVLTESEVRDEVRVTQLLNGEPLDVNQGERREAAERLVDQQLIRNEMSLSRYPMPDAKESDAMLEKFRRSRFPDDGAYQAALRQYGVTEQQLKEQLRWQLAAMRFTDQRFRALAALPPTAPPAAPASADRAAAPEQTSPAAASVDERMNAWLQEARARTRVEFKKEAFQ